MQIYLMTYFLIQNIDNDSNLLDEVTLKCLEERLFKGKRHLKRSQGIAEVPNDVTDEYLSYIKQLFDLVFC